MNRLASTTFSLSLAALAVVVSPGHAHAGGSETLKLSTTARLEAGQTDGTAISSDGTITLGLHHERVAVADAHAAFRCVSSNLGAYVGSADKSQLFYVSPDAAKKSLRSQLITALPGHAVSALAVLKDGSVLAATLPGGTIYRIAKNGKPESFAVLSAEQIWDLAVIDDTIYAATGPNGQVFRISNSGKVLGVALDVAEPNAFSLYPLGKTLLVGTSGKARLYAMTNDVAGRLLHDFDGDEVRSIHWDGSTLAVAINHFESRGISSLDSLTKQLQRASVTGSGSKNDDASANSVKASGKVYTTELRDASALSRLQEGGWRLDFSRAKQFFTGLSAGLKQGERMVSTSDSGKIYLLNNKMQHALVADLEERQAMGICALGKKQTSFVALAGDGAAVYHLTTVQKNTGTFTTEVLDLGRVSQLGTATIAGSGELTLRVRTGPGSDVDSYWSDWKRVSLQSQGNVMRGQLEAPNHRFAQIEVGLRGDGAQVSELSITHAPENLAPIVRKISVNAPKFDLSDNVAPPGRATASWSIDDVDGDDISYEVKLRGKGDSQWFKLTEGGGTTKTELTIDLDTLADGIYELEVIASDEPSNGSANARSDALVSDSFAIDRSAPRLDSLRQAKSTITGRAADALSPIHDVMYRIDDQPFRPASAQDGVFDELEEAFVLNLPELAPGRHRLVLRARDHAGNIKLEPMSVVVPEAEKSSSR